MCLLIGYPGFRCAPPWAKFFHAFSVQPLCVSKMRFTEDERPDLRDTPHDLARAIVEFCRFARANGIGTGLKQTITCLQILRGARLVDLEAIKFGLRSVLCSSKAEWDLFAKIFEAFWGQSRLAGGAGSGNSYKRNAPLNNCGSETKFRMISGKGIDLSSREEESGEAVLGASAIERLSKIDFSEVPQNDLTELERISIRLLRRMSYRLSRRLKAGKSRGIVDLRKTLRLNLGHGGDPIELCYKARKRQQPRLVLFLDVSDSMNLYSLFLLKFAYALSQHFREVESFIFSTRLAEISGVLRARQLADALETLSQTKTGWSGGTRIGDSLHEFNRLYARRLLSRGTVFIILSDGWDTGEPEAMISELRIIKRRVNKLIWLNPLLGLDRYEPITRAMSAALPYLDVFAPAHNLQSLLELEKHLR
jgi:uncharacterized protein with von Willebrand factor type A (vWA) domain